MHELEYEEEEILLSSFNIQCLKARQAELCHHLGIQRPHIVMLQETCLNKSMEEIKIPGYRHVSRRDRHEKDNRGGILTLSRDDFNGLVFVENSVKEERSWHF